MDIYFMLIDLLYQYKAWIILGLVLINIDMFTRFGAPLLPFGISAMLIASLLYGESRQIFGDIEIFGSWWMVLIYFAGLSVCAIGLRRIAVTKQNPN